MSRTCGSLAQAVAIAICLAPVAVGQSPPRDSLASDSTSHPIHSAWPYLMIPIGGAIVLGALFAAAPIALVGESGPPEWGFLHDHSAAYANAKADPPPSNELQGDFSHSAFMLLLGARF